MIGICGNYGSVQNPNNGQTVKTRVISDELIKRLGRELIRTVDSSNWRRAPISLLIRCHKLIKECDDIIIMPARNGVRLFIPLFLFLNIFYKRRLHYVVIGGWLPAFLKSRNLLKKWISRYNNVYVETHSMVSALNEQWLNNVKQLPNFKPLEIISKEELVYTFEPPFKVCTFSRVSKEKGIEDAITAIKRVNDSLGYIAFELDIYGQVDEDYKNEFDALREKFPEYITYKGVVEYNESVKYLKQYFALLFPTYYEGEGFAGTILDAYSAGVPVIATDWKYNCEITKHKEDGLIYKRETANALENILTSVLKQPSIINDMKENCLNRAKEYTPDKVVSKLLKDLTT